MSQQRIGVWHGVFHLVQQSHNDTIDDNSHTDNERTIGANSDTASGEKLNERPPQPKRGKKKQKASWDDTDFNEWCDYLEADGDSDNDDEKELHEVERIMESRQQGDNTEYKVRWKGYTSEDDTWEPSHYVTEPAINEFLQRTSTTHQAKNAHDDPTCHKKRAPPAKIKTVVDTTKYRHKGKPSCWPKEQRTRWSVAFALSVGKQPSSRSGRWQFTS